MFRQSTFLMFSLFQFLHIVYLCIENSRCFLKCWAENRRSVIVFFKNVVPVYIPRIQRNKSWWCWKKNRFKTTIIFILNVSLSVCAVWRLCCFKVLSIKRISPIELPAYFNTFTTNPSSFTWTYFENNERGSSFTLIKCTPFPTNCQLILINVYSCITEYYKVRAQNIFCDMIVSVSERLKKSELSNENLDKL